ncbi:hypothetical protein EW026_g6032 [Hermanssonia centrifuga]|uniref:Uncharacterized protein n=1 Tax=Hermanssonia centrifuga TaxID=98765 RepID=A0A4S4KCB7_9APHY|nr:hypothetical protein EW026_g6032 [Hermanssonia centrifuga]
MRIASAGTLPIVYRALPRTLEHLLIAVGKDVVLQPIVQAVKRSEALTKVTVHVCAGGEKHPQLAAMKIACAAKGIELNVTKDTRMLRSATHGSLVPVVFLPCAKPLKI